MAKASCCQCRGPWVQCFPGGSVGKECTCNAGDLGLIPGLGRSPGEGKGYPLQYSGLENSTDSVVHGVTKSQTRLIDFHFMAESEEELKSLLMKVKEESEKAGLKLSIPKT